MALCCKKKGRSPNRIVDPWISLFYPHDHISGTLCPRGDTHALVQAGLLTCGSFYLPRLPIFFKTDSDFFAVFVPVYSGGPIPDLHRVPC